MTEYVRKLYFSFQVNRLLQKEILNSIVDLINEEKNPATNNKRNMNEIIHKVYYEDSQLKIMIKP